MELWCTFTQSKLFPMGKNKEQFRENEHKSGSASLFLMKMKLTITNIHYSWFISKETWKFLPPWNSHLLSPSRNCSPWAKNKEQFRDNEHKSGSALLFLMKMKLNITNIHYSWFICNETMKFQPLWNSDVLSPSRNCSQWAKTRSNLEKMNTSLGPPRFSWWKWS